MWVAVRRGLREDVNIYARFIEWYNDERAHQSLDWENLETPARAYVRKMPPKGETVVDAQTGEEYSAK